MQDPDSGVQQGRLDVISRIAHTLPHVVPQVGEQICGSRETIGAQGEV